ncbi:hypothetical protein GCM10017557_59310 [Streptomyces aurantiacus]|uniref:Uncharacterized protein n=1 Tax=Streptomyces aurantiacus TaxID=47760 RepID=A0A7G1P7R5_9ACTN|nr:hypothetical protein GCM10017557_59310 [Streptomyces aurantiacus]
MARRERSLRRVESGGMGRSYQLDKTTRLAKKVLAPAAPTHSRPFRGLRPRTPVAQFPAPLEVPPQGRGELRNLLAGVWGHSPQKGREG